MNRVMKALMEQKIVELKNKLIESYERILDKDEEIKNLKIENESLRMAANSLKIHLNSKNNEENRNGEIIHNMSKYAERLEYMKSLENKVFTLKNTYNKDFNDNKFVIGNGRNNYFMVCVADEIGWVESDICFEDILSGCFNVKEVICDIKDFVYE